MKRLMISLLGAFAFAAAAQTPTPADAPTQDAATTTQDEAKDKKASDSLCLKQTGSRIAARTAHNGRRCTAIGRSYSQDDIRRTGEVDLADALRKLDPSIR